VPRIRASNIEEHKELTRGQILEAAQELFQAEGYLTTSLGDVANRIGIGRTTFYEYFIDKEDLLCSLVEATLPQIIRDMIAAVPREAGPAEQLSELATRTGLHRSAIQRALDRIERLADAPPEANVRRLA